MNLVKTPQEIVFLRKAGQITGKILTTLRRTIKVGTTGIELDLIARQIMDENDCVPNFLNYEGFPAHICVSRNFELIHGIPNDVPFQTNDLITVDVGCSYRGWHADAALSVIVGQGTPESRELLKVTKVCLENIIQKLKPGKKVGWIGAEIQKTAENKGFFLTTEFTGHGIGKALHELPSIYNKGEADPGIELLPNMVICVEPMLLIDSEGVEILSDKWTVVSKNRKLNCHFEHMLLITKTGVEVLTAYEE